MPERDLSQLLAHIAPMLHDDIFVFVTSKNSMAELCSLNPLGMFTEAEAITLIIERSKAVAANLAFDHEWALITCNINSDLTAVGFLAAMSTALATDGIAVNAISAYHHDHLFVPHSRAADAMRILSGFKSTP